MLPHVIHTVIIPLHIPCTLIPPLFSFWWNIILFSIIRKLLQIVSLFALYIYIYMTKVFCIFVDYVKSMIMIQKKEAFKASFSFWGILILFT